MVLTKNDTLVLKGVAILLLLWHHMFFVSKDLLFDWHDIGIKSAILSRVCVAIFVFLSGYGLMVSSKINESLIAFYRKRLFKLLLNYWYILETVCSYWSFCFSSHIRCRIWSKRTFVSHS